MYTYGLFSYLAYISPIAGPGVQHAYLAHTSPISRRYLAYVSPTSRPCPAYTSPISRQPHAHTLSTFASRLYLAHISPIAGLDVQHADRSRRHPVLPIGVNYGESQLITADHGESMGPHSSAGAGYTAPTPISRLYLAYISPISRQAQVLAIWLPRHRTECRAAAQLPCQGASHWLEHVTSAYRIYDLCVPCMWSRPIAHAISACRAYAFGAFHI